MHHIAQLRKPLPLIQNSANIREITLPSTRLAAKWVWNSFHIKCLFSWLWRAGRGRGTWVVRGRREAGGASDNEWHLWDAAVSYITRRSGSTKGTGLILCFVSVVCGQLAYTFVLYLFILLLKCLNVRRFPPPSTHNNEPRYIGKLISELLLVCISFYMVNYCMIPGCSVRIYAVRMVHNTNVRVLVWFRDFVQEKLPSLKFSAADGLYLCP